MSLSSLFVVTNALRLTKFGKQEEENSSAQVLDLPKKQEREDMKKTIYIEGMMCKHCVAHVTKALSSIDGVKSVDVQLEDKCAYVELEQVVPDETLSAAIVDAGYEVINIEN